MKVQLFDLETHSDDRGCLTVIEDNKIIPFDIKRVYYMYDTYNGIVRGKHAHKNLQQILVCINGSCKISLDDGIDKTVVELNSPNKALYISNDTWREMYDFSEGCVLMALASELYNEDDYIRDYDKFLEYVGEKK